MAILLRERLSDYVFRNLTIHATDIDPAGEFARRIAQAVFSRQEVERIPPRILEKYFEKTETPGQFRVVKQIRSRVQFARHDLLSLEPIREGLSLIVCKNVLLHFEERQRHQVIAMFHRALRDGGLLAMEHTQKMPRPLAHLLGQVTASAQVYRKIPAGKPTEPGRTTWSVHGRYAPAGSCRKTVTQT